MSGPLSLRLWQALALPEEAHPLAEGVAARPLVPRRGCVPTLVLVLALSQLVLLVLLAGTLFGALWAALVAQDIRRRHDTRTFDVLATTPDGPFGVAWRVVVGSVNRANLLWRFRRLATWAFRLAFVFAVAAVAGVLSGSGAGLGPGVLLFGTLRLGAVAVFFWLDNVQTVAASVLLGVHVAASARDARAAQVGAVAAVLTVQFVSYALLLALWLWPVWSGWRAVVPVLPDVLVLGLYLLAREGLVVLLWRTARARYGAAPRTRRGHTDVAAANA